jgi:site-specific recombinase XerC
VRDKSYQRLPIGAQVKRWLQTLRWEDASQHTLDAYEIMGARLALEFPDFDGLAEFQGHGGEGVGLLRWFLDKHWRDSAAATRRARLSALKSLFAWALEEGILEWNPADKIKPPRRRTSGRRAHPQELVLELVFSQESLRDRICCQLLGRLGLRKNELRLLQARDVNLSTNEIRVRGKGGKVRMVPIGALRSLREELTFHLLVEGHAPTDYLLFPRSDRSRPLDPSGVHRWFKRRLDDAGLPSLPMHELRHTAADHLYRETGDLSAVQMLLGHESVGTTQAYLHPTTDDLDRKLAVIEAGWLEAVAERQGVHYASGESA